MAILYSTEGAVRTTSVSSVSLIFIFHVPLSGSEWIGADDEQANAVLSLFRFICGTIIMSVLADVCIRCGIWGNLSIYVEMNAS